MTVIDHWSAEQSRGFGRATLKFRHGLHQRPLFGDEGLARVLDLYPRERLGVFTMGEDPVAWRTWRRGSAEGLTGDQLLEAAQSGRIWLNLRAVNAHDPAYDDLTREIFDDILENSGVRTFKRDLGLLISSPKVQVFYHLDTPLVTLWQLRGEKTIWVYPPEAPYVDPAQLERIVRKESAEQFAYDPAWDKAAHRIELCPGRMVTWPQNAPHRIENGETMNVSLSVEFMTAAAMLRANIVYANGALRRSGLEPRIQRGLGPMALAKLGLARGLKLANPAAKTRDPLPVSFRLEPGRPGEIAHAA